ncbi:MAG TPA: hypothetical protein ENN46_01530 [Candidatus Woesearchaeota archaeon]|mgnify:CR=1 FL=1|nr:hypothetical protein [Candidatus Woesearchaeota archaeon]
MSNPQLEDFIKKRLSEGANEQVIRKALGNKGWSPAEINEAMLRVKVPKRPNARKQSLNIKPKRKSCFLGKREILIAVIAVAALGIALVFFVFFSPEPEFSDAASEPPASPGQVRVDNTEEHEKPQELNTEEPTAEPKKITECRDSLACLAQQARECNSARAVFSGEAVFSGLQLTQKILYETREESEECLLYIELLDSSVELAHEYPEEDVSMLKEEAEELEQDIKEYRGMSLLCRISGKENDVSSMLEQIEGLWLRKEGYFFFLPEILEPESCEGDLFFYSY